MSSDLYTLEPFPAFVDAVDPEKVSFFSKMGALHMISPSGVSTLRQKQDSLTSQLTNYISLHYYQYEVTVGLYMLTTAEKVIFNFILLSILAAFLGGIYYGLQPFAVRSICQLLYYISGSLSGVEDICRGTSCS